MKFRNVIALALGLTLTVSSTAMAAIPNNSVIIGPKAFSIDYLMTSQGKDAVNNWLSNVGSNPTMYYELDGQANTFTNIMTKTPASDTELKALPEITYYNADGTTDTYEAGNGNKITTLDVNSVNAITNSVFKAKSGQALGFSINGQTTAADLSALENAGYTVTFNASKPVLDDGNNNGAVTNTTGALLSDLSSYPSFDYLVVVSKDGKVVATSDPITVSIVDGSAIVAITTISTTINGGNTPITSNTISMKDIDATLQAVKGTTADGTPDVDITGANYYSENPTIALINKDNGKITPLQPGTVTFKIIAGNATKEVTYTIAKDPRTITSVTADITAVNITTLNAGQPITLTVKDQFGDLMPKTNLKDIAAVKNSDGNAITQSIELVCTDNDGTVAIKVIPEGTNTGSGNLIITDDNGKTLLSIPVVVGDGATVATRKLDTTAKDNIIDVNSTTDNTIILYYDKYNSQGLLIGPEDKIGTTSGTDITYVVSSSDPNVASVDVTSGAITVTAKASGTATINITEGAITRASYNVTVIDSTPVVSAVTFNNNAKITKAESYSLNNVISSIKDNSGNALYLSNTGNIYATQNEANENSEINKLGNVKLVSVDFTDVGILNGNIQINNSDPAAGQTGTIVVQVLDKSNNVIDSYVLEVNIPSAS